MLQLLSLEISNSAKKYITKAGLILWIVLPFVLLVLPSTYFDSGSNKCLSVILLDIECFGCGITRAVMRFIHLDFTGAWEYNKLSFIVSPLLIIVWIHILGLFIDRKWFWFLRKFYTNPNSITK